MAAQTQTLKQIYADKISEIGTDTITTTQGRAKATPFSDDDSLEIDQSVVTQEFLDQMRSSKGLTLNTIKYSETVDRNA